MAATSSGLAEQMLAQPGHALLDGTFFHAFAAFSCQSRSSLSAARSQSQPGQASAGTSVARGVASAASTSFPAAAASPRNRAKRRRDRAPGASPPAWSPAPVRGSSWRRWCADLIQDGRFLPAFSWQARRVSEALGAAAGRARRERVQQINPCVGLAAGAGLRPDHGEWLIIAGGGVGFVTLSASPIGWAWGGIRASEHRSRFFPVYRHTVPTAGKGPRLRASYC